MSERGRARGRGRSRPVVPGETGTEPSGAAGITAPTSEVISSCIMYEIIVKLIRHFQHQH